MFWNYLGEVRHIFTSNFRGGSSLVCLDGAHQFCIGERHEFPYSLRLRVSDCQDFNNFLWDGYFLFAKVWGKPLWLSIFDDVCIQVFGLPSKGRNSYRCDRGLSCIWGFVFWVVKCRNFPWGLVFVWKAMAGRQHDVLRLRTRPLRKFLWRTD